MKIGAYVHWAGVGGAEDMIVDEIRCNVRRDVEYFFYTEEQSGHTPVFDELGGMGIPVNRTDGHTGTYRDLYQRDGIQLLHVMACGDVLEGYQAALDLNIPVVETAACVAYSRGWELRSDIVTPVYLCQKHWEHGSGGKKEFKVIVGGVNLSELESELRKDECKSVWGLDPTKPVLGWFGRFDQFKCPVTFVDICKLVSETNQDCQFIMFGGGVDLGLAVHRMKMHKLDIKMPGFTRNKSIAFGAMDVYCFLTWQEAFGRVMVEAMACGVPIVTSDYPVCHEICANLAVYESIDRRDPMHRSFCIAYADDITRLLKDEKMRSEISDASRQRALYFSAHRMAEEYVSLYEEIISGVH